jgi:hypothetical protein
MIDSVIDLQELRIGNLLEYRGELVSITMLSMDIDDEYNELIGFVKYGTCSNEHAEWNRALALDLKRIPLTSEWLERCGFKNEGKSVYVKDHFKIGVSDQGGANWVFYFDRHLSVSQCAYLHQLQNLYFLLMGQELTIKTTTETV